MLRDSNPRQAINSFVLRFLLCQQLQKLVVENVLAFNEGFWTRLAARTDSCKSEDYKAWFSTCLILISYDVYEDDLIPILTFSKNFFGFICIFAEDYEELAISVMSMVDLLVHKTSSATDILKAILKPIVDGEEEIHWLPRDPDMIQREREGHPDEGFLSEVSAQLPQAKEGEDKPGLEAMLLKVLQLYASSILSKRSCAKKGEDSLKKRIERTLIRTFVFHTFSHLEGGSSQQCILIEYLKGIQSREEEINVQVLQGIHFMMLPLFFIGYCIPQASLVYWVTNSSLTEIQDIRLYLSKERITVVASFEKNGQDVMHLEMSTSALIKSFIHNSRKLP
ncbi:LOW QUALITY PROTEIN: hypothetical protein NC653_023530 [Populus alba x Populus x berolinensis]|uniref:Uncharacterized protein n=1 Tax=Populus alba x Populus x berolinensis TaxID=444605 RepID=A0AAD6MHF3_9ROSI|nr:LOW QUALITY PROTEIN: hypothetical protein NC653_023530 [Populus alba x Populus x berolinensis]